MAKIKKKAEVVATPEVVAAPEVVATSETIEDRVTRLETMVNGMAAKLRGMIDNWKRFADSHLGSQTVGGKLVGVLLMLGAMVGVLYAADLVNYPTPSGGTGFVVTDEGNATVGGTLTVAGTVTLTTDLPVASGIALNGTYTGNAIDFSGTTINPTGSGGPCLIRAGSYGTPIDYGADNDQSGMVRLYSTSSGTTSYDRGIFAYCEVTSSKGAFPIAGLAEANNTGTGPSKVQAGQFIAHLGAQSSGAVLTTLGGDATAGMYGIWAKVAAAGTATCDSGSRVAPIWADNQMSGTVSGEEYGIFATTGASVPDAFIGFETTSSGYSQLLYFDETFNSGAGTCVTTDAVPGTQDARIRVWYDGKQYYLPLYR